MSSLPKTKVRILPGGSEARHHRQPAKPGDPDVVSVTIKGHHRGSRTTASGCDVDNFKIERNESISTWRTESAQSFGERSREEERRVQLGRQRAVDRGAENVRVLNNDFHDSLTGLETSLEEHVAKNNNIHHNTTGIGLYHPSAASASLGGDGGWDIVGSYVHDSNEPNDAPPGSMSASCRPVEASWSWASTT